MITTAQATTKALAIEAQESARQAWETAQEYLSYAEQGKSAEDRAYWEQAARGAQMDGKYFTSQAIWALTKGGL